jgi:hypothetical protein
MKEILKELGFVLYSEDEYYTRFYKEFTTAQGLEEIFSFCINHRASDITELNYSFKKPESTAKETHEMETFLKRKNKNYKYIPFLEFKGMYECFSNHST